MSSIVSMVKVYTIGSGILENCARRMYANTLIRLQLNRGGGEHGNKSEGFAQEVHRRHPPLGRRGPQRRLDRQRPRDEPFVGAIVPLAQRHLPPRDDFNAVRSAGLLLLRGRTRALGPRRLVRPRDRQRSALAETLEEHREGRAAPHTDQDRPPEAQGRRGLGDPLANISARSGLKTYACRYGASRLLSTLNPSGFACQHLLAEGSRSCGTRSLGPEGLLQEGP